jgi:gamma-glutamylcysteine synthetase
VSVRDDWTLRLASEFTRRWPDRDGAWRRIGREGEYPLVHADGTAGDIAALWSHLAELVPGRLQREGDLITALVCDDVTFSSEVGKGTIEVIVGPEDDLHGIRARHEAAVRSVVTAAAREGLTLLGYGVQPLSVASPEIMTPKRRYGVLHQVIGDAWLWFALTASDQVHVDVTREETFAVNDLANLLSPAVVALCGNSSVLEGRVSGVCSARESHMGTIQAQGHRHGMTEGPCPDAAQWIGRTMDLTYLMHVSNGINHRVGAPFGAWLSDQSSLGEQAAFEAWLHHEHYIWNSARPRTAHGTVELRAACQQPWSGHMATSALSLGMVQGWREIAGWLFELWGDDAWNVLRAWHGATVEHGLAAPEPADGFLDGLLGRCEEALVGRGRGEEVYLAPLRRRLSRRSNPAMDAQQAFESGGIQALIAHAAVR